MVQLSNLVSVERLMRSLGTLKLPDEDADKFLKALEAYGQERSAAFLRRCAYALIRHHEAQEPLQIPLAFQLGYRQSVFGKQ